MKYELTAETLQKLLDYLAERPFKEAAPLIQLIQTEVASQAQAKQAASPAPEVTA